MRFVVAGLVPAIHVFLLRRGHVIRIAIPGLRPC